MDTKAFISAYNMGRNGCNERFSHFPTLGGRMVYTDGVKELADAGCYWLLDIIGTECLTPLRKSGNMTSLIHVVVGKDEQALMRLTIGDGVPPIWQKHIPYTDLPPGIWVFELVEEEKCFALALVSEH